MYPNIYSSPASGYGTQAGGYYFVQTPNGGTWSTVPASQAQPKAGQVLSAQTSYNPTTQSGPAPNNPPATPSGPSEAELQQNYWNELDTQYGNLIGGLDPIVASQNAEAGLQRDTALSGLSAEEASNQALLTTQNRKVDEGQASTLEDLTSNLRNQIQTGANYLGLRGAGDSSAAGMYNYALGRVGSKARGDVMAQTRTLKSDIEDRAAALGRLVLAEKDKIQQNYSQALQGIQTWFAQAKLDINKSKAADKVAASRDATSRALAGIDAAKTWLQNQSSALNQWAMSNSTNLSQLQTNLAGVNQKQIPQQTWSANFSPIATGQASNTTYSQGGYFPNTTDKDWYKTA